MLLKRMTDFILQSRMNAIGAALACASLTMLDVQNTLAYLFVICISGLSVIIAGFITLRRGALDGLLVLGAATLPYVLGYVLHPEAFDSQLVAVSVLVIIFSNVLTWFGAVLLQRYGGWAITLQAIAVVMVIAIVEVHWLQPNLPAWWETQLTASLSHTLVGSGLMDASDLAAEKVAVGDAVKQLKPMMTQLAIMLLWVNTIVQLALARWWQGLIYNPGGFRKEFYDIRMSSGAGIICLVLLVASYWNHGTVSDVMTILYLTFGIAGISLLHKFAKSLRHGWIMLVVVYSVLPITLVIFPMVGLLDVWMDLRKRIPKQV